MEAKIGKNSKHFFVEIRKKMFLYYEWRTMADGGNESLA